VTAYLDCAATTPLEPRVRDEVVRYLEIDFGNTGSRHDFGLMARRAVEQARDRVAALVAASRGEVIFTSGATESNNLTILGLAEHGLKTGKTHLISTQIEHPAVLEPLRLLTRRGFNLTLLPPNPGGFIEPQSLKEALRDDTLLVSVMHVNNETGIVQPLQALGEVLAGHEAFFHVDGAQGFGKEIPALQNGRIDLISISGHKIYAPKGIGALVMRRRDGQLPPLTPLVHGGGQERGLRPGTLAVPLIAGLGKAAELALAENQERSKYCLEFRQELLSVLQPLQPLFNGDPNRALPSIVNLSFPGLDAESVLESWENLVAVSTGAACSSQSHTCSHVLSAMKIPAAQIEGAIRLSWSHMTPMPDIGQMVRAVQQLLR
jgi:cysteine desulfurase